MAGIALRALAGVTRPTAEGPLDSPRHERSPPSGRGSSSSCPYHAMRWSNS